MRDVQRPAGGWGLAGNRGYERLGQWRWQPGWVLGLQWRKGWHLSPKRR